MTQTSNPDRTEEHVREYDRLMLRSAFVSLFWVAIMERRKRGKFTFQSIADAMGIDKSGVSRWFSNDAPNFETDTISDIAGVLDLELLIAARDRSTGVVLSSTGPAPAAELQAASPQGNLAAGVTSIMATKENLGQWQGIFNAGGPTPGFQNEGTEPFPSPPANLNTVLAGVKTEVSEWKLSTAQ